MNETNIFNHILRKITEEKVMREAACSSGVAKDFSEYKNLCGVIQGLSLAESIIKDLVQKMEHDDE